MPMAKATRSSLACLPCRSRHIKCDGKRPCCSRCIEAAEQCHYVRSRRGGLDRAALAQRRKGVIVMDKAAVTGELSPQYPTDVQTDQRPLSQSVEVDFPTDPRPLGWTAAGASDVTSPAPIRDHIDAFESDALVGAYYQNFHELHPFIVPQKQFRRLRQDLGAQTSSQALIAVLRLIGNVFIARELSMPLKVFVEACLKLASPDPIMVQCRLLYSLALFWYSHEADAKAEMNAAIQLAIDLRMFRLEFAWEHGGTDPVVRESWRRTWWMLYIVDTYYAGTLGTMTSRLWDIESTVELPCEESNYEFGDVPDPSTLQDFDCREFSSDDTKFSSFAYLIGAVRCTALALSIAPKRPVKADSIDEIQSVDYILDGWLRLLPKSRSEVVDRSGQIDELMFQAHLVIHM
ncbi:hypothetical protein ACMYSQ_011246 [Aspergillus niger]